MTDKSPLLVRIRLLPLRLRVGSLTRLQSRVLKLLFLQVSLPTFDLFPSDSIDLNSRRANIVVDRLCKIIREETGDKTKTISESSETKALHDQVVQGQELRESLKFYFLLQHAILAHATLSDKLAREDAAAIQELESYGGSKDATTKEDIRKIRRIIRKRFRSAKKECRHKFSQRIEQERQKYIRKVDLKSVDLVLFASFVSTMFLISGFLYNKFFFYLFDLEVSGLFSVTDYISSSVDRVVSTLIATAIGCVAFYVGSRARLSDDIQDDLLDTSPTKRMRFSNLYVALFFLLSLAYLGIHYYQEREILSSQASVVALLMWFYLISKLPLDKYVEKPQSLLFILFTFGYFAVTLMTNVWRDYVEVIDPKSKPQYSLQFLDPYSTYIDFKYVAINSSYLFLFDTESSRLVVLPRASLLSMTISNTNEESSSNALDPKE